MLLTENVETIWNAKTKRYYENLGYEYTKINDPLIVKVTDLKPTSKAVVQCMCDYCGNIFNIEWVSYNRGKKNGNLKDCCNDPSCMLKKSHETNVLKYGVESCFASADCRAKAKLTNIEKYGAENPFASEIIKEKIRDICLEKYGTERACCSNVVKSKIQDTCLEKYNTKSFIEYYAKTHKKELHPNWKGGVQYHRNERDTEEYRNWRNAVYIRDKYTCQCCGDKNGNGKNVTLNAHHILNWNDNEEYRFDIDNGITLCVKCHNKFHSLYGKCNNTKEQLIEFIKNNSKDMLNCKE